MHKTIFVRTRSGQKKSNENGEKIDALLVELTKSRAEIMAGKGKILKSFKDLKV